VVDPVTATGLPVPGPGHDADSPEIDRGKLRSLFLESLAKDTVRWGCTVTGATPLGDGSWRLLLDDGTSEDADLVVGADGAWSRIRPALSDATPGYTGVTFIETGFDDCDTRHPALARMVGNGTLLATADGKALLAQRNSNGHIRVYVAFRAPHDWQVAADVESDDTAAVCAHLLKLFDGWDENLLYLLRHHDGGLVNRPVFVLPAPHTWEHVPGITLLGDAAHLMPPSGSVPTSPCSTAPTSPTPSSPNQPSTTPSAPTRNSCCRARPRPRRSAPKHSTGSGQGTRTMRWPGAVGVCHACSMRASEMGAGFTARVPEAISPAREGSSAMMSSVVREPWPLPMMFRLAARSRNEGRVMSRPAMEPIWIQNRALERSVRAVSSAGMACSVGRPHR
jgi:hypothetical protein